MIFLEKFDFCVKYDILPSSSKDEHLIRRMLVITPKKKTPAGCLFLLSVLPQEFLASPTCYLPKEDNWLYSEECEPSHKESSHKMRGLRITPSSK